MAWCATGRAPISTGRGATNLGFADNAAIILDNPAGMSNVAGTGLVEGGVDTLLTDIQYSDPQNPNVQAVGRACPCGFIGYIQRAQDSPWTYGIGAFSPAGFSAVHTGQSALWPNDVPLARADGKAAAERFLSME